MVDGNKIIIIFYFIYCVCANYKCCIMPSSGPDLENKVSCIQVILDRVHIFLSYYDDCVGFSCSSNILKSLCKVIVLR